MAAVAAALSIHSIFMPVPARAQEAPAASASPSVLERDEAAISLEARGAGGDAAGKARTSYNGVWAFFQMLIVLALILGCVYGLFAFIRTVRKPKQGDTEGIRVLARASLAPGRSVHVVKAGSKAWLLGASEGSVTLISELDDKELIDRLELEADKDTGRGPDFRSLLSSLLPSRAHRRGKEGQGTSLDFLSRQRDKLRKL